MISAAPARVAEWLNTGFLSEQAKCPRVVVLCAKGFFQRHLTARIAQRYALAGIVWHRPLAPKGSFAQRLRRYRDVRVLVRHALARISGRFEMAKVRGRIGEMFPASDLRTVPAGVPELVVADINDAAVIPFVYSCRPDIVCVNGTNLLREALRNSLSTVPLGVINLHTGLSPYARGGNCNLWVLLEGHLEWIGVTVHHIDGGIDRGDIILSAQTPLLPGDNYELIEARTFDVGIGLMLRAVECLAAGRAPRVRQWQTGRLYLKKNGYEYEPWLTVRANRVLAGGAIERYLARKVEFDAGVRIVDDCE